MKKLFKKKETNTKTNVLEVLDAQIAVAQQDAARIMAEKGSDSMEYSRAVTNLTTLAEQRANVANSVPQRKKIDPNAIISGTITAGTGLASTLLLLIYDENHVVPKWFKNRLVDVRDFLKSDK